MALEVKKVDYFNITIDSNSEEASQLLSKFANAGIGLLAFKAVPLQHKKSFFTLFPNNSLKMKDEAKRAGLKMDGPYNAIIIKSDNDDPGECAGVFKKLSLAGINAYESCGIADIKDSYGMVLYLDPEDCDKALKALKA
ncbi:MAG: hypothetical protein JXB49_09050 [Bacteroidales bacterium]|nr:hypothetical protein [Bacteroidales bacterium]